MVAIKFGYPNFMRSEILQAKNKRLKIILSHDSMKGDYKRPPEYRPNVMLELMTHIEKFIS